MAPLPKNSKQSHLLSTYYFLCFCFRVKEESWKFSDKRSARFSQLRMSNDQVRPTLFESIHLGYVYNSFIVLSVINILLAMTATLGNILIFLSLRKECLLHPPSRLLLRSLASTDLFVGLVSQPLAVLHAISILTENLRLYRFTVVSTYFTSAVLSGMSLFVVTFISIDRLLALSLGVRYRQTVTIGRVRTFLILSWLFNIANGVTRFLSNKFLFYVVCVIGISVCVVTSTFCYAKIYYALRLQQMRVHATSSITKPSKSSLVLNAQRRRKTRSNAVWLKCCHNSRDHCVEHITVQPYVSQGKPNKSCLLHIERYKKTVSSALWIHFTLLACYLPYSIVSGMKAITGDTLHLSVGFTATLIFFNSSLNPALYLWRIREVRKAVKKTIKQYCGLSSEA